MDVFVDLFSSFFVSLFFCFLSWNNYCCCLWFILDGAIFHRLSRLLQYHRLFSKALLVNKDSHTPCTHTHFKAWDLKWLIAKLPGYLLLVRVKKKNITSCGHTHTSHLPQVSIHRGRQSVVKTFPSNWQRNKRGLTQLKSLYNIFLFVTLHVCKDTANAQKCTRLRALCSLQKWGFHSDSLYTWHTPYVHLLGHTNPI